MRKVLLSLLIFTTVYGCSSSVESDNPCYELAKRLLPDNAASFFIFEKVPSESDFFELEQTEDNKIVIRGITGSSASGERKNKNFGFFPLSLLFKLLYLQLFDGFLGLETMGERNR